MTIQDGKGVFKVVVETVIVGLGGFLIVWGATQNTVDSLKTESRDFAKWKSTHSVEQASTEAKLSTKLDNLETILKEMREENKQNMKEIRDEMKKKRDR